MLDLEKNVPSESRPKRRSRVGIVFLVLLLILAGAAGYIYYSVCKAPLALDDPQAMAAAKPMSAAERFSFSAADQAVHMKVSKADIWNFVLDYAGADFLNIVNKELSPYSLSVSGCGIQIDENGGQLNLELYYKSIRIAAKVPFELEVSGQHFRLKPSGVMVGSFELPVAEHLSSVVLELDLQLPVITHVTGVSYAPDALVLSGTMKEDIRSLIPPERTVQRLAVFDESWQSFAAVLDTDEGYTLLLSHLEQNPGEIEDLYNTMFMIAGPEITQAYLDSHMDLTLRILPGIDVTTDEAERAELMEQEDPLFSLLERFFASVVHDYNGKIFKLIDGVFLKKLEPYHATRYGNGIFDELYQVLNPDSFSLVVVDVENGYTEKTPVFHRLVADNQEFTQPVDFKKTYILGLVFRGVGGGPFLMYETKDPVSNDRNLTVRLLSEEECSALLVSGKFGVWTG